ncbi:hypothetical protein SK803_14875 [Lentzea sp. BCCO 10_0856]|uniref:HEAT repeat domain-containing protein n=1 Tax=Lentzea miocenica TaxID=3095431 RepID=A0ABU4T011_9PSEU|nr:hypothetical protein [Lentzea sp. BCCO 10_0856]MDX8031507.1 hypothetical protein [Lentzea sp. BCCO 10_0856]
MSDEWVRNEVSGSVAGPVTQVGAVHIHAAPAPPEPLVDLAVRITNLVSDDNKKTNTLLEIVREIFEADPKRAAQVLALAPDVAEDAEVIVTMAVMIAPRDPERASRMAEPYLDERTDDDLWLFAVLALALSGTSPDRTALLVRKIVEEGPPSDTDTLAWLAAARHPDDPRDFARLADLAERAALKFTDEHVRGRAPCRVAEKLATVDLDRAIATLRKVSADYWASACISSGDFQSLNRDYALVLFDHHYRALRVSDSNLDHQRENLAVAAAAVDLYRAEAIAARICKPAQRVAALTSMAQQIAATDRGQALRWLEDAMLAADADRASSPQSYELLGVISGASANLDPALSRRTARIVFDAASEHRALGDLINFANWLAEADPAMALQLIDRVLARGKAYTSSAETTLLRVARSFAEIDPATAMKTLDRVEIEPDDDWRRIEVVHILIKIATNLAIWDPADAKAVLNRAQRELRAVRPGAYPYQAWQGLAAALVRLDPSVLERLAGQMSGQDDVVSAMAIGVVRASESRTA